MSRRRRCETSRLRLTGCSSCGEASRSLINLLQNFAHQGQDLLGLRLRNRSPEVSVRHVVAHQAHFVGLIFNQFVYEAGAVQGVYALVEILALPPPCPCTSLQVRRGQESQRRVERQDGGLMINLGQGA